MPAGPQPNLNPHPRSGRATETCIVPTPGKRCPSRLFGGRPLSGRRPGPIPTSWSHATTRRSTTWPTAPWVGAPTQRTSRSRHSSALWRASASCASPPRPAHGCVASPRTCAWTSCDGVARTDHRARRRTRTSRPGPLYLTPTRSAHPLTPPSWPSCASTCGGRPWRWRPSSGWRWRCASCTA